MTASFRILNLYHHHLDNTVVKQERAFMVLWSFQHISEWHMNNALKPSRFYSANPGEWMSQRAPGLTAQSVIQDKNIKISVPLPAAVTCLSEQGGAAAVGDCVRWAGAMPALVQECLVPCKDDCTFTPWSKFTACSSDCDATRSRRRSLTGIIYNICLMVVMPLGCWSGGKVETEQLPSLIDFWSGTDHCQPHTCSSTRTAQKNSLGPNETVTRLCASLSDY